jgi:hypothetical protein
MRIADGDRLSTRLHSRRNRTATPNHYTTPHQMNNLNYYLHLDLYNGGILEKILFPSNFYKTFFLMWDI